MCGTQRYTARKQQRTIGYIMRTDNTIELGVIGGRGVEVLGRGKKFTCLELHACEFIIDSIVNRGNKVKIIFK